MKIRKIAAVAVTAVLTVTMLTGCTTFNNFKEAFLQQKKSSDVTIQIGIYEPMSGADSDAAKAEIKGIELAHEVYPNIGGKIVELVYSDNSSDIDAAETAINNLISKKPDIILGSYGSVYRSARARRGSATRPRVARYRSIGLGDGARLSRDGLALALDGLAGTAALPTRRRACAAPVRLYGPPTAGTRGT